jgi:hypothetical protein
MNKNTIDYDALAAQAEQEAKPAAPAAQPSGSWLDSVVDYGKGLWNTTIGALPQAAQGIVDSADPSKNPMAIFGPGGVALDMLNKAALSQDAVRLKAEDAFKRGDYAEGTRHVVNYLIPLIGPAVDAAGDKAQEGKVAEGLGEATGVAVMARGATKPQITIPGARAAATALKESAKRSYLRALGPTTKPNKVLAERVVEGRPGTPGLIERGTVAATRKGLQSKIHATVDDLGQQLEDMHAQLPPDTGLPMNQVLGAIDTSASRQFTIRNPQGVSLPTGPDAMRGINFTEQLKNYLRGHATQDASGNLTIPYQTLREFRQKWDALVAERNGYAGSSLVDNTRMNAYRSAASAIREQLNSATPDIAAINREFSFWKNAQDVIDATVLRSGSQATPMTEQMATAGAIGGGLAHGLSKGVLYGAVARSAVKLFRSTGWRTMSAVTKDRLANLLSSGKTGQAIKLMNSAAAAAPKASGGEMSMHAVASADSRPESPESKPAAEPRQEQPRTEPTVYIIEIPPSPKYPNGKKFQTTSRGAAEAFKKSAKLR